MDKSEFASTLNKIADDIEKIAAAVEEDVKQNTIKLARDNKLFQTRRSDYGELHNSVSKATNPLVDFCLS
jgi:nitrate/nitrite-specific signal transduction histidine kinase